MFLQVTQAKSQSYIKKENPVLPGTSCNAKFANIRDQY